MQQWRRYLALGLALCVMVTSHAIAAGRGGAAHPTELCVGLNTVVVYLDENGDPTAPPHYCPDCALHLFTWDGLAPGDAVFQPAERSQRAVVIEDVVHFRFLSESAWPRAPPEFG